MQYEGISDDLPVEAVVARDRGDPDWEELCVHVVFAEGCSRASTHIGERDERSRFEAEPVTIKSLTITRRRFNL